MRRNTSHINHPGSLCVVVVPLSSSPWLFCVHFVLRVTCDRRQTEKWKRDTRTVNSSRYLCCPSGSAVSHKNFQDLITIIKIKYFETNILNLFSERYYCSIQRLFIYLFISNIYLLLKSSFASAMFCKSSDVQSNCSCNNLHDRQDVGGETEQVQSDGLLTWDCVALVPDP